MKPWRLSIVLCFLLAQTAFVINAAENATTAREDEEKSLEEKKSGLTFLERVLSLTMNNTAASIQSGVGNLLSADGGKDSPVANLDLSDVDKRSQFIAELMTPGASGSYATSNSYQQYGKVINYAVSLSYAPLQPVVAAQIRQEGDGGPIYAKLTSTTTETSAPVATPDDVDVDARKAKWDFVREPWNPNIWNGHSYYHPYYFLHGQPTFYFPSPDEHQKK